MSCEINGTCTTKPPNTTVPSVDPTSKIPVKHEVQFSTNQEYCTCNMQNGICDINCCCDPDCSYNDRLIFSQCDDEILHYDTRYCEFIKYIYMNNTPFQWHINQNGLFCVLKSNIPPYYIIQRKQPLESIDEAEIERLNRFGWNKQLEKIPEFNSTDFHYGNPVWVIQRGKLKRFQIPNQFISNKCLIAEDVKSFKNVFYHCVQTEIDEENGQLNMNTYFQDMFIVNASIAFNRSSFKNQWLQNCPKNVCLPIMPEICDDNFVNCQNISKNDIRVTAVCNFLIAKNMNVCQNLVKKVQYNFYHNGSNGFTKIEALFVLQNFSEEFGARDLPKFVQEFSVNFWWNKKHPNFSSYFSGNPGYKIGKPLLIGTTFNFGNKTHFDLKIKRNGSVFQDNFLTLPENVDGNCILDNNTFLTVEFGYNLLTKCKNKNSILVDKKHMYNETRKTKTGNETRTLVNASTICRDIQRNMFKLWNIQYDIRIGMFGNANVNNITDWIAVMYKDHPEKLLNRTSGQLLTEKEILKCSNVINQLKISVYHTKVDLKNILNQEKILGVLYEFNAEYGTFSYDKESNMVHYELNMESQVIFYDITMPKEKKVVDPPSLQIRLPYDFFYPFIRIDNSVSQHVLNHYLVVIVVLFVILCNTYF